MHRLEELAWQTDKGVVLAGALVDELRRQAIPLPTLPVIERICAEAITRGNRRVYRALNEPLVNAHRRRLDGLLERREDSKKTPLQWLRQSPDFDYLPRVVDSHAMVRRYAPAFLAALDFSAAPAAQDVLDAIGSLRVMHASSYRLLPADAPTAFIKKRWEKLVFTVGGRRSSCCGTPCTWNGRFVRGDGMIRVWAQHGASTCRRSAGNTST